LARPLPDAIKGRMPAARLVPPGSTIHIDGYTDNQGSAAYGQSVSLRRAEGVRDLLRARLGNRYRYVVAGHGSSDVVATNTKPAGRQRNRRVEIHYTIARPSCTTSPNRSC
jgi:outer membrane protein OmpA-like peptidoglycan-associated protein